MIDMIIEDIQTALANVVSEQKEKILLKDALFKLNDLCKKVQSAHSKESEGKHKILKYKESIENKCEEDKDAKQNTEALKRKYQQDFKVYVEKHKQNILSTLTTNYNTKQQSLHSTVDTVKVGDIVTNTTNHEFNREDQDKYLRKWIKVKDKNFYSQIKEDFQSLFADIAQLVDDEFESFKSNLKEKITNGTESNELFKKTIDRSNIDRDKIIMILNDDIFPSCNERIIDSIHSMEKHFEKTTFNVETKRIIQKLTPFNHNRNIDEITKCAEGLLENYKSYLKNQLTDNIKTSLHLSCMKEFDEKKREIDDNIKEYFNSKINYHSNSISLNEKIVNVIEKIQDDIKREINKKCENLAIDLGRK